MILIDSNLVIYSALNKEDNFFNVLEYEDCRFSVISQVEVMGFKGLKKKDDVYFKILFESVKSLPITDPIIYKAIELRQKRKLGLGDSFIAATAIIHNCILYTRNTKDFDWINDLEVHNPINN